MFMTDKSSYASIPKVDIVEPFYIGNFYHKRSLICNDLIDEAQSLLSDLGWEESFAMYYYVDDPTKIRLYFRIAYVSNVHIDGCWDDIKKQLKEIVPLIKSFQKLRLYKQVTACWIEPNTKNIDWSQEDYMRSVKLLRLNPNLYEDIEI